MADRRVSKVAVIGAGWAGLAAAVRLCDADIDCTVFEASRTLGGRARRVPWAMKDGREISLDNGQHILIGAYRHALGLLGELGVAEHEAFERTPMHLVGARGLRLKASSQRAPWHLVAMLLTARGVGIDERWSVAMFMRRAERVRWRLDRDCTVAALLDAWRQPPGLTHKLWEPLCIAALNTPMETASAQVFLNVLRDSLGGAARDSDLLLPRVDLGGLLPDAVAARFARRGDGAARIRVGARVQNLLVDEREVSIAGGTATKVDAAERFDAAVVATPPGETARLLAPMAHRDRRYVASIALCEAFEFQPIVTVYLLYRDAPRWPSRMLALEAAAHVDHFGQWAFDRSERLGTAERSRRDASAGEGLVAVVISADGAHRDLQRDALVAAVAKQLSSQCGLPSEVLDARVIVEKRATFACTPSLRRPDGTTPHARLVLAGDYVGQADPSTHYPATIEAAVISGGLAAARVVEVLRDTAIDQPESAAA